jgi:plastocyanin
MRLRFLAPDPLLRRSVTASGLLVGLLAVAAPPVVAQSLLDRTPNLTGGWVGAPHSVYFTFLHRFNNSGAPLRQIVNRPTFLLAYAAPVPLLIGAQYATRSDVVDRYPNEWEAFARYRLLSQGAGHPLDVAAQAAYNVAAESLDGELSAAARIGPFRLLAAGRALQSGYGGDARFAVGGGATLRLGNWFALAADVARLVDPEPEEKTAWGVGLQFGIPLTPHSLSLQATNTNSATLQGASRGGENTRWGFEFTVPITLARYFGRRQPPPVVDPATPPPDPDAAIRAVLVDSITRALRLEYEARRREDSLRITLRGDSVRLRLELDSLRRAARADSLRRAAADAARRAAEDSARRAQPVRRVSAGMRNLAFEPARITVDVGTTIVWRNNDQVEHTVTASDRSWDSGIIRPGASWERTFTRPGSYDFYCTPHPFMKGVVIVRPAP